MAIQSPSIDIAGATPVGPSLTPVTRGYWQSVRRRLGRDPVTLICAAVLLLIVVSALAAPWLGPVPRCGVGAVGKWPAAATATSLAAAGHLSTAVVIADLR